MLESTCVELSSFNVEKVPEFSGWILHLHDDDNALSNSHRHQGFRESAEMQIGYYFGG